LTSGGVATYEYTVPFLVLDSSEFIDVRVPVKTEFVSLDVDGGKVKSPLYKITNNAQKKVSVEVSKIEVANNASGVKLLSSTTPDPSSEENSAKLSMIYRSDAASTPIDLVDSTPKATVMDLEPLGSGTFEAMGTYFGDYSTDKKVELNIQYTFKTIF
ncbi:hypothetical protein LT174_002638, partial [Enterococcus faecalis]|nr:hypothetical protein [Enterococcus faecalis]